VDGERVASQGGEVAQQMTVFIGSDQVGPAWGGATMRGVASPATNWVSVRWIAK